MHSGGPDENSVGVDPSQFPPGTQLELVEDDIQEESSEEDWSV